MASTQTVSSSGADLHVVERGNPENPTIVFVHGFPDAHGVWEELTQRLARRFHTVAYDVRGIGASTNPDGPDAMTLERLADDLAEVVDATSPDAPVHLVGHDWGAFQCWEAVTSDRLTQRIAGYTPIAGPRTDHMAGWLARRLRPNPAALGQILGQARRSWYIAAARLPGLPELALRRASAGGWETVLGLTEGIDGRSGHPADSFTEDAIAGLALYRKNMPGRLRLAQAVRANVPVQLIVPTKDPYISTALYADAERWAPMLWRRDIRAGHWVQRSHPDIVARAISEFVGHVEGADAPPALQRARLDTQAGRELGGRLAVVTGGGAGIGRQTTLALARHGAEVVVADIDLAAAERTAKEADGIVHAHKLDVGDRKAVEAFARKAEKTYGVPSIVVNNAGIGIGGSFIDTSGDDWQRTVDINLMGVVHGARLFATQMVGAGVEGNIINLASAAAYTPSRSMSAYATTKAAVLMLSECMRADLADQGIGVTAICPGIIATDITKTLRLAGAQNGQVERAQELATRAYALRGYGPDKVASAILYAIRTNPAVMPVAPEAHVMQAVSRFAPGVMRATARIGPPATLRRAVGI